MTKGYYLPRTDKDRESWLNNFATIFEAMAPTLGFTPAEIAEVVNFAAAYTYVLKTMNIFKVEDHEWTMYKDLLADGAIGTHLGPFPTVPVLPAAPAPVPAGIFKSIAKIVQRIKNHTNYDESIGKNLGIIGPVKIIDYENAKVKITVRRSDGDGVALDFVKSDFDGVVVYGGNYETKTTVPAGSTPVEEEEEPVLLWTEIGRSASSPYVDKRKNATNKPETRHYKMRYLSKHTPIGKDSDTINVIASVGVDLANIIK